MRAGAVILVFGALGCHAPAVGIDEPDTAAGDVGADVGDVADGGDGDVRAIGSLPDGRPCGEHDEDHDGVPDDCDDCPGLPNPEQRLGASAIGNACRSLASGDAPFDRASARLFFDPFVEYDRRWTSFGGGVGAFGIDDSGERMSGGTGLDEDFHFLLANTSFQGTVVATALLDPGAGIAGRETAGILLRGEGDPKQFLYCFRGQIGDRGMSFGVAASLAGCSGGPCVVPILFAKTVPTEIPGSTAIPNAPVPVPVGLRASITSGSGGATHGTFECRVFDPAVSHSVHNADPRYVITFALDDTQWIPKGAVGLGAQRMNTRFESLDVFFDPSDP